MKVTNILLGVIAALLLAGLVMQLLSKPAPEPEQGIAGTYTLTFYSEDDSEAARRVAARYNQQARRLVLMDGGQYFLFQGETVEAGQWSRKGETLTVGKAVYKVTDFPAGMAMKGESYLMIGAWKE